MKRILPLVLVLSAVSSALAANPTTTSISPTSTTAGSAQFTLTVNGTNFVSPGATVNWNGLALTTTFVSSTQLTAIVPAADVAVAGTASITVNNSTGKTSNAQTFTINNPVPTISSISPTSTTAGSAQFTLTVNGTNFVSTSTVNWNGSALTTTFVSATQLTATVPAANVATGGTASVTVVNPAPGGGTSNSATFTINNPVPTISSISPTSTTAGSAQFTLTVNGTNFVSTSTVNWNGSALATTFVSSIKLTATVSAANVAAGGTVPVTVVNPTPAGGTSNSVTFTINNPVPTISSISPTSTTAGSAQFTLTVNGTNFVSTSKVNWNGSALTTTFVSATQLTATVPAANVTTAGAVPVTVVNPTPVGGTSNSATFTINNPVPTITSISPNSTTAGSAQFTLTVNGSNFISTSKVNWNGSALATTFVSSTQLTATVPVGNVATAGTALITVVNPTPGGGTSNAVTFTINNPVPTISLINPSSTLAGGGQFTLTVNGTNFVSTSTVNWSGSALTTTFVSSTQLTATVPAAKIATGGTVSITVVNPAPGGGISNAVTFTINNPVPTISSLSPSSTAAGSALFTLTVNGSNFVSTSTANWNGSGLATTFVSSTQLTATVPAADVTTAGTASITVVNPAPGGGTSNSWPFTINNPAPTISSISPTCVTAQPSPSPFPLTVNGTNFVSTSVVNWNGSALPTTFGSSTQLTATVPAADVATVGTASITVFNPTPGGGTSNSVTFTVTSSATPVINPSPTPAPGTVGNPYSYTITASSSPPPTSYTASALPPGLKLESPPPSTNLGLIDGTPTAVGIYQVIVSASNGPSSCSNGAQASLVITIGPFFDSGTQGVALTPYQIPAYPTGAPAAYNATGLPAGLIVNTSTGVISGTPTTVGTFLVTISASYGSGASAITGSGTLTLTIDFSTAPPSSSFPGETTLLDTGSATAPPPGALITFPNTSTGNSFTLIWNDSGGGGPKPNKPYADHSFGGLTRSPDSASNSTPLSMQYNPYDPTTSATPNPSLDVWRGNPSPPNVNSSGQFGDPRASWYVSDPWPAGNYLTSSYWGGPTPQFLPLTWPDSGHNAPSPGKTPSGLGQYPNAVPTPTPDQTRWISKLGTGTLTSVAELGNVWDPAQLNYTVTNSGGSLPDIPTSASVNPEGGGGYTLAVGRPEFSVFDKNGMRAWQLLDVFGLSTTTPTAGLVNINTASRDVLRALAAGILQNADAAIVTTPAQQPLYPPTVSKAADQFADAVINSRPLLSTAALSAIRVTPPSGSQPEPFFGNPHQYSSNQTQPTEWNDQGREELFSKILNLATTRSRNFRVFVTGQSLDKNGNVLSTVTKVYQVFIQPNRNPTTGAIISQQVVIKYEGSM